MIVAHKAVIAAPIQHIDIRRLDLIDFILGIINFPLALRQLFIGFLSGIRQLALILFVLVLAVFQLGLIFRDFVFRIRQLGFIFRLCLGVF